LIIVISVMNGFDRELTDKLLKFNYHIIIENIDNQSLGNIRDAVVQWEGVRSASLFVQTQVFMRLDELVYPAVVKGIDFSDPVERDNFYQYVSADSGYEGFFLGEGLRRRFFGSREFEFYPLDRKLRLAKGAIRGFFKVGLYDIDNNYLIADLGQVKALSPNYLMFLGIRLDDAFSAKAFKEKINTAFPTGVLALTWMESNQVLFSALQLEKLTMFIILSLIILVAAFNIFATVTVRVVEKTKDIGILKSLGCTRRRILGIFSAQGLLIGITGTGSGALLGLGICLLLKKYHFIRLPQEIYYIEYLPVAINYADVVVIMCVGFLLSYVFSLFPALRAARLSPSEALRYE